MCLALFFLYIYKRQMTYLLYLLFFNNKIRADDASSAIQDSGHKWMAENQVKMFLVSRFHFLSSLNIQVLLNIVETSIKYSLNSKHPFSGKIKAKKPPSSDFSYWIEPFDTKLVYFGYYNGDNNFLYRLPFFMSFHLSLI